MNSIIVGQQRLPLGKLVCVGRNFVAHIAELGNEVPEQMVLFCKPGSALTERLAASHGGEALHYEAELCFAYQGGTLAAVALGLDLTKRQLQSYLKAKGLPWERAKAFDGSALLSPFVAYDAHQELEYELCLDGARLQYGRESLMIHSPAAILAETQGFMALQDGDVLMTGTPSGVGLVPPGGVFTGRIWQGEQTLLTVRWEAAC
ncbi:fumarylacetoacetate hydrolase family protein [Pseudaeromonas paramecii]|uniref:Fumarylacetoacetate hydrolase family protein n=1 Tax=Pseudaeromonas paramecii TaxID=2138166 RepID=A0ABP8QD76_9GAMM